MSDATNLTASIRGAGFAWGTNLDERNAEDNNGRPVTIIGRGLAVPTDSYPSGERAPDLGSSEFVLSGRRFNAATFATSIDVHSDLQLTCESDEGSCRVTATLLVQQMQSPASSNVCFTTSSTRNMTIATDSHHQKMHLVALNVPFKTNCNSRSFIVKTQVTLTSEDQGCVPNVDLARPTDGCDYVVVEHGTHNDPVLTYSSGRSITSVVQDFPVIKGSLRGVAGTLAFLRPSVRTP